MSELDNHVHVVTSKSAPYGRQVYVRLNGQELTDISNVRLEFCADDLNMVTVTFPARITTEEAE